MVLERALYSIIITSLFFITVIIYNNQDRYLHPIITSLPKDEPTRDFSPIATYSDEAEPITDTKCIDSIACNKASQSPQKPKPNTKQKLIYHSKNTKYLRTSVGLKYFDDTKGYGLYAKSDIKTGDILFAERPLLKINDDTLADIDTVDIDIVDLMQRIHETVLAQTAIDAEFMTIWDQLSSDRGIYEAHKNVIEDFGSTAEQNPGFHDFVKINTNQHPFVRPFGVYGLLSKINFGLPQNVAVMFGEEEHDFMCIVMATTDISKGTELQNDYFYDWFDYNQNIKDKFERKQIAEKLVKRKSWGYFFGFDHNKKWMKVLKTLGSDKKSDADKFRIVAKELYPDGIIGKRSGKKLEFVKGNNDKSYSAFINKIQNIEVLFDAIHNADTKDLQTMLSRR